MSAGAPMSLDQALTHLPDLLHRDASVVVLTHDNPDPDAMASAAGVAFLLRERVGCEARLAYGGIVGRAENRALLRLLNLPLTPVSRLALETEESVQWILVDTQPPTGNHSLPDRADVTMVIDHHPERPGSSETPLCLVSSAYGATSTIVSLLIRTAGLEPPPTLATALFYGVKSDTRSLGREASEADQEVYRWLFARIDTTLLSEIEHPRVPISYFRAYHRAYEAARIRGNVITVDMGDVYLPDIVPEIAERLLSLDGAKWSVALGAHEDQLYVSLRTSDRRMNAGNKIRTLTEDLGGSAGGHGQMAGARLPLHALDSAARRALAREILERFAETLGVGNEPATPIV